MLLILLIVLAFLFIGGIPAYGYYRPWGSSGRSGLLTIVLVALALLFFISLLSWSFYRPVYYTRPVEVVNPPPQVIDRRPITVINPPPNSGQPVRIVPGEPQPPSP